MCIDEPRGGMRSRGSAEVGRRSGLSKAEVGPRSRTSRGLGTSGGGRVSELYCSKRRQSPKFGNQLRCRPAPATRQIFLDFDDLDCGTSVLNAHENSESDLRPSRCRFDVSLERPQQSQRVKRASLRSTASFAPFRVGQSERLQDVGDARGVQDVAFAELSMLSPASISMKTIPRLAGRSTTSGPASSTLRRRSSLRVPAAPSVRARGIIRAAPRASPAAGWHF